MRGRRTVKVLPKFALPTNGSGPLEIYPKEKSTNGVSFVIFTGWSMLPHFVKFDWRVYAASGSVGLLAQVGKTSAGKKKIRLNTLNKALEENLEHVSNH